MSIKMARKRPSRTPRDVPEELQSVTPRDVPEDLQSVTPMEVPEELQSVTPREVPEELQSVTPRDVPEELQSVDMEIDIGDFLGLAILDVDAPRHEIEDLECDDNNEESEGGEIYNEVIPRHEKVPAVASLGYLTKAVTSYLLPSQLGDILAQDRVFATAVLAQPGLKHACGLARIQKEPRLLIASGDGFLYIYDFNTEKGGNCKLLHVHDLGGTLEGVIELNIDKCGGIGSSTPTPLSPSPQAEYSNELKFDTAEDVTVIIENTEIVPDNSYASIVKDDQTITA
uniref:Uncharacterized protein n=1 Tax=Glossina austeni TaxID=7395 RepID=A0A1A9V1E5_GLOAU